MAIDYRNGVSIALLIFYFPALCIAALLATRHGLNRNSGWLFLIIFALARIIGAAMQLATISQPHNVSLYIGSAILLNIGLSPLLLAASSLLSRVLESINKTHHTLINSAMIKLIHTVITVALILGIVGGTQAGTNYGNTGIYKAQTLSKVGSVLFIVAYIAILLVTVIISFSVSHAEAGEKRLLLAVAVSLPLLLVRLIYSLMTSFSKLKGFNSVTGDVTILLCVALIEEMIVMVIYEGVGLTLKKISKAQLGHTQQVPNSSTGGYQSGQSGGRGAGAAEMAKNFAKRTIIGRIITSVASRHGNSDVEMQD